MGAGGVPLFDPNYFSMTLLYDGFTHRPFPLTSRSRSAIRMPFARRAPAETSLMAMPTRMGPLPGSPVMDISPILFY